jgi:hypothetical protein
MAGRDAGGLWHTRGRTRTGRLHPALQRPGGHTYPNAEIILFGVEEPLTLIHAANESVAEIADMALADAPFLQSRSTREGE